MEGGRPVGYIQRVEKSTSYRSWSPTLNNSLSSTTRGVISYQINLLVGVSRSPKWLPLSARLITKFIKRRPVLCNVTTDTFFFHLTITVLLRSFIQTKIKIPYEKCTFENMQIFAIMIKCSSVSHLRGTCALLIPSRFLLLCNLLLLILKKNCNYIFTLILTKTVIESNPYCETIKLPATFFNALINLLKINSRRLG